MERIVIQISLFMCLGLGTLIQGANAAAIPGFSECMFNGRSYAIGESFHPFVNVRGREYEAVCYNCTCQPTTIAQCEEVYCPPADCDSPIRLNGKCCPVCIQPNIQPIQPGPKQCLYEGLSIPHGETFHPPSMVHSFEEELERRRSQTNSTVSAKDIAVNPFCTQCECTDGIVQCSDISTSCPSLSCNYTEAFLTEGSCCMECPTPPPRPRPAESCTDFDGGVYLHGDSWNPYYPGFGKVDCVNCTCVNGNTECVKSPCPDVPYCEPGVPVPDIVLCCLECIPRPITSATSQPPTTADQVSYEVPDLIPETTTADSDSEDSDISPPVIIPCQNNDYIINIYKHKTKDSLALENTETFTVDVYTWTPTEEGDLMKTIVSVDSLAFRDLDDFEEFVFVGKTLQRRVNGLTTREKKRNRIRMCTEDCSTMVVNMLRPVNGDINCSDES